MDEKMVASMDSVMEDEIRRGWRIKTLPDGIIEALEEAREMDESSPVFRRVRFTKLTAKKKRLINDHVIDRYHQDLQNKNLLSSAQLRRINIERGEWSEEEDREIEELTETTQKMMQDLYSRGVDDREEWLNGRNEAETLVHDILAEGKKEEKGEKLLFKPAKREQLLSIFDRWVAFELSMQEVYDAAYAEDQGAGDVYKSSKDLQFLGDNLPLAAQEALMEIEDVRDNIQMYYDCLKLRNELMTVQIKQARMLQDSVEQRRDQAQELAQLYYCTETVDDQNKTVGPLAPTFEEAWDLPDEVTQWMLIELYLFFDGNTDTAETREFLEQWGFIPAPREIETEDSSPESEESPEEPSSNSDSSPSEPTPADSSALSTPTT